MTRWLLPVLFVCACDGSPEPAPAKAVDARPADPEPNARPEAAAASAEAPIEAEWIVWFRREDGGVESRWYTKTGSGVTKAAARKVVAVGDGSAFWQIRRADAKVDVFDCACFDAPEGDPMCAKTGEVAMLGLEAVPMDGGDPVALEQASTETIFGEVDAMTLSLRGGVGTQLFVETTDAGYYCGAHGSYGGVTNVRDPSSPGTAKWPALTLPGPMLRQAAMSQDMLEEFNACMGGPDVGMASFLDEEMRVVSVHLSLDAGMLVLRWNTEADAPYVCAPDYAFHGFVDSGLLPSASALELAPPLPAGLQDAFSDIGSASAVGWSRVEADRREAVSAWFAALPETPWPAGESTQTHASPTPTDAKARAGLLDRGRTLTREKKYAEAVEVLTEAIGEDPTAARPYAARCYAYLLSEQLKKARPDCERALTLHPGDRFTASVQYNLGQIAEKEGKPAQAKAAYEASLKLRENATVRKALEALQ
ncbi:MAG: tetratricopeptide repeat protein [Nannocystaceae bacterium]|nr:tetratricopeptide repeat protein [bacterium]